MILLESLKSIEAQFISEIIKLLAGFVFTYLWGIVGLIVIWFGYKNLVTTLRPRIIIQIEELETKHTKHHNLMIENALYFMGVFTVRKEAAIEHAVIPIISERKLDEFIQKHEVPSNPNLFEISLNEDANKLPEIIYEPKVFLSLSNKSKEQIKTTGSTDFIKSYDFNRVQGCVDNVGALDSDLIKLLNENNIVVSEDAIILEENVTIKEKFWSGTITIVIGILLFIGYMRYMSWI